MPRRLPERRDRGQTSQDYALGIGIFLLTLSFVIGFFPSVLEPYDTGAGAAESATANRVADAIIAAVESGGGANDLDSTAAAAYFRSNLSESNVGSNLSLREGTSLNATVVTLNRSSTVSVTGPSGNPVVLAGGDDYDNQSAVTVSRVITMKDDVAVCRPACRLVVRVW